MNREHCFAAAACPYDAFYHNPLQKTWEVDATICGDCPAPCLNFCDQYALRWGDDLIDLKLVKAELDGTMKPEEVTIARNKHKEELKQAAEEAKKKNEEGVIALTRANFEQEVLRSDLPVAIDCWADWCNPCKKFSPIFEATAKQYAGIVKFAKLDTEAEPALARGLGVQALPTTLVFYKGQLVNMVEGALPADQFQMWLYQTLAAVRQYEKQLSAEADEAITAAARNIASLGGDTAGEPGPQSGSTPSSGVILDPHAGSGGPTGRQGGPGPQSPGGLYIPGR